MPYLPRRAPPLPLHAHTAPGRHLSVTCSTGAVNRPCEARQWLRYIARPATRNRAHQASRWRVVFHARVPTRSPSLSAHAVSRTVAREALAASCVPHSASVPHCTGNTHAEPPPHDSRAVSLAVYISYPKASGCVPALTRCIQPVCQPTSARDGHQKQNQCEAAVPGVGLLHIRATPRSCTTRCSAVVTAGGIDRTRCMRSLWHNSAGAAPHAQPPERQRAQSCPPAHIAPSAHLGRALRRAADYLLHNSLFRLGQSHLHQL
jgi:hypothetical protein